MTAPRDTGWLSRLIVTQVYLVTSGSVYAVTEELTESRQAIRSTLRGSPFLPIAEYGFLSDGQQRSALTLKGKIDPHSAVMHLIRADEQLSAEAMRSPGSRDEL